MAKYSSIRHVTCHSLFANDIETTNPKQKNKLYLDALSIDSNDSSILSYILLSGISNGNIPFIENLSYQIPKDQFDLKFLWKLPYPDATEFQIKLIFWNLIRQIFNKGYITIRDP